MTSSETPARPRGLAPAGPGDPPVLYDASRLCTRVLNATPNGIDRLDALLARGLFGRSDGAASALVFGLGGPRLLPARDGLAALERAERAWGELDRPAAEGKTLAEIARWLAAPRGGRPAPQRLVEPRPGRIRTVLGSLRRVGLRRGADPAASAAKGAVYLNTTHFPLEWPSHVAWLEHRADVRLTLLIHDLLPLDRPDFFWAGEADKHRARLALLARRGAGAIVTSAAVADRLGEEMALAGRRNFAVHRAPPPVAAVFEAPARPEPALMGSRYFITCGTIEPRKNHRLLLRVWRRLVARLGEDAPKLIVVGKRGWLCDEIVAEMRDPALAGHVLEVSGLTSGDYKALMDHACALLAPSFAEGFGLPVAEALTAGAPVIASDIAAFREQGARFVTLIDPAADDAWLDAIEATGPRVREALAHRAVSRQDYMASIEGFLRTLA